MVSNGHCIILTSHSMEECEILCARLAIMVNGQFECLGSPQHLKDKYGEGYMVSVRVDQHFQSELIKQIQTDFPSALVKEQRNSHLLIQIGNVPSLKNLFQLFQKHKQTNNISDYSISQTTMDDVFISFAQQPVEVDDFKDFDDLPG